MYIEVKQDVECGECGSRSYESFRTATHHGLRCLKCGHEEKKLHPHLAQPHGVEAWVSAGTRNAKPTKF